MLIRTVVELGNHTHSGVQRIGRRGTRTDDSWVKVLMGKVAVVGLERSGHGEAVKEMMGI